MHCGSCNIHKSSHGSGRVSGRQYPCEFYKRRKTEQKHNRVKRANPVLCPAAFISRSGGGGVEWFPQTCPWKEACFHTATDLLTAGVSQIKLQASFCCLNPPPPVHSPADDTAAFIQLLISFGIKGWSGVQLLQRILPWREQKDETAFPGSLPPSSRCITLAWLFPTGMDWLTHKIGGKIHSQISLVWSLWKSNTWLFFCLWKKKPRWQRVRKWTFQVKMCWVSV